MRQMTYLLVHYFLIPLGHQRQTGSILAIQTICTVELKEQREQIVPRRAMLQTYSPLAASVCHHSSLGRCRERGAQIKQHTIATA
jgi:hypothetical protein